MLITCLALCSSAIVPVSQTSLANEAGAGQSAVAQDSSSGGQPPTAGASHSPSCPAAFFPADHEIGEFVRPYIERSLAMGMVVGLLEPDGRRRILTFGKAGEGAQPLTAGSVFEIGSITKTFTGTLLADMVRRGQVKLDDPVAKYLPAGVRVPSLNRREITLLDLATHSSGLPRYPTGYTPPDPADPYAKYGAQDLYDFLGSYRLDKEPGAEMSYSNVGVGLLGHALARAAGAKSYKELVSERVLEPLGMSNTFYGREDVRAGWMTRGHDREGKIAPHFDVDVLAGAGGMNSNVHDMLTYLDANLGEPHSPIEEAMREARREHRPGPRPNIEVGLAWMTMKRGPLTLAGHNGGTAGYSTYIALDPETQAAVVVLTNTTGFEYADYIGRELLNPERGTLVPKFPEPAAAASAAGAN